MPHPPTERLPELRAVLDLCCGKAELLSHQSKRWAAGIFSGARHTIALRFVGAEAIPFGEALICELPQGDIALAGKLVADASILCTDRIGGPSPETTIVLELLILDET